MPSDPEHGHAYRPKPSEVERFYDDLTKELLDAVDDADADR